MGTQTSGWFRTDPTKCRSGKHLIAEVGEAPDGHCKGCLKEWRAAYYAKRREEFNERRKQRWKEKYVPHPKPERLQCSQGHTYAITGRNADGHCLECRRARDKARQKERYRERQAAKLSDPLKAARYERWERTNQLRRKYGLTAAEYDDLETKQEKLCAACGNPETLIRRGKLQRLSVDHDHITGKRRALICNACNRTIGLVNDDLPRLRKLVAYLELFVQPDTASEASSNGQLDLL